MWRSKFDQNANSPATIIHIKTPTPLGMSSAINSLLLMARTLKMSVRDISEQTVTLIDHFPGMLLSPFHDNTDIHLHTLVIVIHVSKETVGAHFLKYILSLTSFVISLR